MTELELAIYQLTQQLGEVESQLAPLQAEREYLRAQLLPLVRQYGGKIHVPGYARMELSTATVIVTYDRKQVEQLILKLVDNGLYHIADALRECKRESQRPDILRILRDIPKEEDDAGPEV